jgi:hypothetical protein
MRRSVDYSDGWSWPAAIDDIWEIVAEGRMGLAGYFVRLVPSHAAIDQVGLC